MNRVTLNGRPAREVREVDRDPYDWADQPVRSALLGGSFPGTPLRSARGLPLPLHTRSSPSARAWRVLRAVRRWLRRRWPWSLA